MIQLRNNICIFESGDSLTPLAAGKKAKRLYLDYETTAFDPWTYGNMPYKGHRACGFSVTWDDNPTAYYVPIRHEKGNVDLETALAAQRDLIGTCDAWVNQDVKFDAHFAAVDGIEFNGKLICTLTRAKMLDSDRLFKGGYGLDALMLDWCETDITTHESEIKKYLDRFKRGNRICKDYALCATDVMGKYACMDVFSARTLDIYEERRKPESLSFIWDVETKLTPVLFDMERRGVRVDPEKLLIAQFSISAELTAMEQWLHETTGQAITPSNSNHCYELLCVRYGLPVLAWTDDEDETKEHNPSFTADALMAYLNHPVVAADPKLTTIVKMMQTYRDRHTLKCLFIDQWLELHDNGVLHPRFDQLKRTGRMACSKPNMQQLSEDAKAFIEPRPGNGFLSMDYSQIEFRIIAHYLNNRATVEKYQQDPNTDYHEWVASLCHVPRKPAKNINFAAGYGGGQDKISTMLMGIKELVNELSQKATELVEAGRLDDQDLMFLHSIMSRNPDYIDKRVLSNAQQLLGVIKGRERDRTLMHEHRMMVFNLLCRRRGEDVYRAYHAALPELRRETKAAERTAQNRGWVQTLYGRMRHIMKRYAWKAFNSVCQGSAADLIKETTVRLAPRYNSEVRALGLDLDLQVHDENLLEGPKDVMRDPKVIRMLSDIMESPTKPLRVPVRVGAKYSDVSWKDVK